jgi:hypothetical protein
VGERVDCLVHRKRGMIALSLSFSLSRRHAIGGCCSVVKKDSNFVALVELACVFLFHVRVLDSCKLAGWLADWDASSTGWFTHLSCLAATTATTESSGRHYDHQMAFRQMDISSISIVQVMSFLE